MNHPGRRICCFHSRFARLPTRYSQDQIPITRLQSSIPRQSHQCSQQASPLPRPLPRRRQRHHSHPSFLYLTPDLRTFNRTPSDLVQQEPFSPPTKVSNQPLPNTTQPSLAPPHLSSPNQSSTQPHHQSQNSSPAPSSPPPK
jgi:hypothetical protein